MTPQMPILTPLLILMFQRNTIGNVAKMKSVQAAMAIVQGQ